jgi:Reverse transcriptase (RNA-dependent DNA polymerase)
MARMHYLWRRLNPNPDSSTIRDIYHRAESRCRLLVRNYEIRKENEIINSNNLGKFYRFVNSRLANKQGIGVLKDANGMLVTNDAERAELLNNYFCSVCTKDDGVIPDFKRNKVAEDSFIDHITFNTARIERAISKLKLNLAGGIDGFPPLLIKKLSPTLLEPLSLLYSSFLSVGKIPHEWRRAIVTPIHKSGSADDVSNYRPIALTCVFSKIMERVVANEISGYLLQHGLISRQQHGFLAKRSTATNLAETLNDWTIAVNNRQSVTVAYIDYRRAFDSVCNSKLFIKLSAYGIAGSLLSYIKVFLYNRSQVPQVGSARSSEQSLVSGIVQGSC